MNSVLRSIVVVGVRRSRFLIYEHLHFNVTNKPQKTQMVINTNMSPDYVLWKSILQSNIKTNFLTHWNIALLAIKQLQDRRNSECSGGGKGDCLPQMLADLSTLSQSGGGGEITTLRLAPFPPIFRSSYGPASIVLKHNFWSIVC